MADEMFDSEIQPAGDLAGVFEYDGDTGYFYLYQESGDSAKKVLAAIRVISVPPDFEEDDLAIRWSADENTVGLFIRGQLWAAFNSETRAEHGGSYQAGAEPKLPSEVIAAFEEG
jgi:hypothetical protein